MNNCKWLVLRDLKRPNAKERAWQMLRDKGFEVFTPLKEQIRVAGSRKIRERVPVLPDLLFVKAAQEDLDGIVARIPTLQYRFVRGAAFGTAMTVPDREMEQFIAAVSLDPDPVYFRPDEITPEMCGRSVRIVDGPLGGYEGVLVRVSGKRKRHVLVSIPDLLSAAIEIDSSFLQPL